MSRSQSQLKKVSNEDHIRELLLEYKDKKGGRPSGYELLSPYSDELYHKVTNKCTNNASHLKQYFDYLEVECELYIKPFQEDLKLSSIEEHKFKTPKQALHAFLIFNTQDGRIIIVDPTFSQYCSTQEACFIGSVEALHTTLIRALDNSLKRDSSILPTFLDREKSIIGSPQEFLEYASLSSSKLEEVKDILLKSISRKYGSNILTPEMQKEMLDKSLKFEFKIDDVSSSHPIEEYGKKLKKIDFLLPERPNPKTSILDISSSLKPVRLEDSTRDR